jgi:hypothetical protein
LISLVIIVVLMALMFIKLEQMFKQNTVFFTSKTTVSQEPPMTILSTYPNETVHTPYMMAFMHLSASCSFTSNIKAYNYTYYDLLTPNWN